MIHQFISSVSFCLFFLAGLMVHPSHAQSDEEPLERAIRPARERLIEFWLIGGTDRNPPRRDVGKHQVSDGGWKPFVRDRVAPVYDWGIRRFWLHNPFGTIPNQKMQFAQYLDARESKLDFLTRDFVKAWKPVVDGNLGQPTELICYLGAADFEDGNRLQELQEAGDPSKTLAYMLRAIQPILQVGGSIGADAATGMPDDGPAFHFYKFLEQIGIPVYVESRPRKVLPGWAEFPVVAEDRWWHRSDPLLNADSSWGMAEEKIKTPIIRLIVDYEGSSSDPAVTEALIARVREALLAGHTVAFRSDGLRRAGIPITRLTDGIDEALGVDASLPDSGAVNTGGATTSSKSSKQSIRRAKENVLKPKKVSSVRIQRNRVQINRTKVPARSRPLHP